MSTKQWGAVALAEIIASPILLAIALIVCAVVFIAGYITLLLLGLVSAVIYALFGMGLVWLTGAFSRKTLEKHPQIIFIVPMLFLFGLVVDHLPNLAMLSLADWIGSDIVIAQNSWFSALPVALPGYMLFAVIALVVAVAVLAVMVVHIKRKYWWVK